MKRRPLAVTIIAALYVVVGLLGIVFHFKELTSSSQWLREGIWVELLSLLALVAGIYLFGGKNWARWLAIVWMAAHVVISAFHSVQECAIHALFLALIAWFLLRPPANLFFRHSS